LTGCINGSFGHGFRESVEISKPLTANGRFSLENTNGSITVATWNEPRVRVEAIKAARSEHALREIDVRVEGEGDAVDVSTRLPRGRWFGGGGKVDYTITVPGSASVSVRNVNGRIEIRGVGGAVRARDVNGSIEAEDLRGAVEAETVNGTVDVRMAHVAPHSRNRIATTNGTVRVTLPRDAGADVEASTVNGAVHCDFDLQDGHVGRKKLEGRIGEGGARFELRAVNGTAGIDRGVSSGTALAESLSAPEATPAPAR
jgi:hypothetical protein